MRLILIWGILWRLFAAEALPQSTSSPPARLIDMHMHCWDLPPQRASDPLRAAFAAFHLQRGVVSGPATAAVAAADLAPDQLLVGAADGVGSVLPSVSDFSAHLAARRIAVLGELDGAWDGEPLATARLRPYLGLAEERGVPMGVFTGVAPPGTSLRFPRYRVSLGRPSELESILAEHPRLRVFLMQAGWPFREETVAVMHAFPEVYADPGNLSGNPSVPREAFYEYLRALKRAGLGKRIMFGSGLEVTEWAAGIGRAVDAIQEAPFLSAEERDDLFFANAARFLRLGPAPISDPAKPHAAADGQDG